MIGAGGGHASAAEAAAVLSCYRGLSSMANIDMTPHRPDRPEHHHRERVQTAEQVTVGGSTAEALAGLGAVVLAILALIGLLPVTLTAIATIAIGAGLFLRGSAISSRLNSLRHDVYAGRPEPVRPSRSNLTIEMLGGLACIALGILALLRLGPAALLPIAAIVFGGTLILSAGVTSRLAELETWRTNADVRTREVEREAARGAAGTEVLVGIGAVVLGILTLVSVGPGLILVIIANLAVGGAMLLNGAMLGTRTSRRHTVG